MSTLYTYDLLFIEILNIVWVCRFVNSSLFLSLRHCFRKEVVVLHGGHDLNVLLMYELELCTSIACCLVFDVHVTVHRVKFLIIKPTRCTNFSNLFLEWNSTCFGQFLCLSSGVFHCTHSNGICHTGLLTACEQDQDGTSWMGLTINSDICHQLI